MLKLFGKKKDAPNKAANVEAKPAGESVPVQKLLSQFEVGQQGVIVAIGGDGKIRRRLFDMGVTPGAEVYLRKKAPLGDPIEVTLRGYELTLRHSEAAVVTVKTFEAVQEAAQDGAELAAADKEA